MELFAFQDLTFSYPGQTHAALEGLRFEIPAGQFLVIAGPSGCGKSTLLRQFKSALTPHGQSHGQLLFRGTPIGQVNPRTQASVIGFVQQSPENQIVTDKVWHELAFGLEALGYDRSAIRSRVAEMASFFGIQSWFHRDVVSLSGGQKQLLNLASVMALQPEVLILDEPTSQLDPIAASSFLSTLGRIHRDLGTTVILTEHRLDEVIPMADRLLILDGGRVLADGTPQAVFSALRETGHPILSSMPAPMQIWSSLSSPLPCPLTPSAGRLFLEQWAGEHPLHPVPPRPCPSRAGKSPWVVAQDVWFRYESGSPDILRGLNLEAYGGELLCILGGNGVGKSTALSLLSGARRPSRGKVSLSGKTAALLPQDPQVLFVKHRLEADLWQSLPGGRTPENQAHMDRICSLCRLTGLLDRHPYDLSGGEQQRAALAQVLLRKPQVLLLDEPTKGLDGNFTETLAEILKELTSQGVCVILVSHDVEFCAAYGDRCALFFDGSIAAEDAPLPFFSGLSFYTTAASRMARTLLPAAITAPEVIAGCGGCPPPSVKAAPLPPAEASPAAASPQKPLPVWRKVLAGLSGAVALAAFLYALAGLDLKDLFAAGKTGVRELHTAVYGVFLAALLILTLAVSRKAPPEDRPLLRGRLSKRTVVTLAVVILAIPLTIFLGPRYFHDRKYYVVSLLVLVETILPFFLIFEGRKPQAREMVILAVLCGLAIGGRAAFLALPGFKPVAAMVILSGVAFGGEAGFLVGAVTMLASNMLFGQGPWTPWQMFAMGLLGLAAGILYRKGVLRRGRLALSVFGALVTLFLYGGVMNPASILMYQPDPTWPMIWTAFLTGLPVDLVHAAATALFLWFLAQPMLEKLDRVKVKYGLLE